MLPPLPQVDGARQLKLLKQEEAGVNPINQQIIPVVDGVNLIITQEDNKMAIVKEEEVEAEEVIEAVEAEVIIMIEEKDLLLREINLTQSQ